MKKYILCAGALAFLPTMAHAQDTGSFSGFYAGVQGGIDNFEVQVDVDLGVLDPAYAGETAYFDGLSGNGVGGDVFLGYQRAFGDTFFGIEGFGGLKSASVSAGVGDFEGEVEARETYGAAVRFGAKVSNSTALYARVGWVNTRFETTGTDGVDVYSEDETEDAIQFGGGIETMIGRKLSLRAEYLYEDYGSAGLGDGVSVENGVFRAGLTQRF